MTLIQRHGTITISTGGPGFSDLTQEIAGWLSEQGAADGVLTAFIRHTSASLLVQENADPDVLADLSTALGRLAPREARWRHQAEGPDDMPGHIRAMLTNVSLSIPVIDGRLRLGTWQAVYLAEHRDRPHRREVALAFIGSLRADPY